MQLELPKWYDLHLHLRQDEMLAPLIADVIKMGCAGVLAMPNTKPPVGKVFKSDGLPYWSIEEYLEMISKAGGDALDDIIVPLYLTKDTTPQMIEEGAKAGVLRAAKYYPPHGTTGAEFGYPFMEFVENGVFEVMRDAGVVLCIHGEEHGLEAEKYFDRKQNAEEIFYSERLPHAVEKFPDLKIVGEHVTTKTAVDFIKSAPANVGATITPQHLLYTVGHLLQGLKYHLYCLPLLKYEEDRAALRDAVADAGNTKFFAGTDSAPHTQKVTECGCAAGCYTGGIAPQLYAEAFEEAGVDLGSEPGALALKNFLCLNGPNFYGLDIPSETFTIEKAPQKLEALQIGDKQVIPLPIMGVEKSPVLVWSIL
ncbi:MAG: amidohydrolase family protein [Alphaproteobacteria bacterium]|nr:amidohydrolase family protein [Alphaproteobacteria bacterium]